MSNKKINDDDILIINSVLYTVESKSSAARTKAELEMPDPTPETANAALKNNEINNKKK